VTRPNGYPWRPDDQFVDERQVKVGEIMPGDQVWVGIYLYQTGERLPVLAATATTRDNRIAIDMQPCEQ